MKAKPFISVLVLAFASFTACAKELVPGGEERLLNPSLVTRFYELKMQPLFFFERDESVYLRTSLKRLLDSSFYVGLDKEKYHYRFVSSHIEKYSFENDSVLLYAAEKIFADALISYCKDVYTGSEVANLFSYNEVLTRYVADDNAFILNGLVNIRTANELEYFAAFLEPVTSDYLLLKQELRSKINSDEKDTITFINHSLNTLRAIKHFQLHRFIVINTASAQFKYYAADTLNLIMKVVVGKTETPTPRFSAFCNEVILYPYWNVPYSIAVKEMLPAIKRRRSYLNTRNLQVIDTKGRIIDPSTINWQELTAKYFPYQLRQSTGCDNALGVIKFNLTDPFSVYMHDTNNKIAFLAGARYFSHGCIRLEKPVELASELLPGKINADFLESCIKNQKPVSLKLEEPVPVFVVYMTAEVENGQVKYFKDVYKLLK